MRIDPITLFVEDPKEVRDWYIHRLGLRSIPNTPLLVTDEGDTRLIFRRGPQRDPGQVQLHFQVPNVDAFYEELVARGVRFGGLPKDMPWGWRHAYTADPAGRAVEIVTVPAGARGSREEPNEPGRSWGRAEK